MTRLSHLREIYSGPGPFATVYLDATRTTESGAHEVELRWNALTARLSEAGAGASVLERMRESALAPTGLPGEVSLVLVATADALLLAAPLPVRLAERADWGALPDLAPMAVALGRTAAYVLVHIDRQGADIDVVGPLGQTIEHEAVQGGTENLHRVGGLGGWASLTYAHRSENLWEQNAEKVARQVDGILARTGIEILAVVGDVRASEKFHKALGHRGQQAYVALDAGSRAAGSDEQAVREELGRVLAAHIVRESDDPVSRFREQQGAGHGAAVSGRAEVVEALQKAQVDALLVTADFDDDSPLWIGPDPLQVATSESGLAAMGVEDGRQTRADAALLRAAVASDAGVVVMPGGRIDLTDGVGALLRYADASTSS